MLNPQPINQEGALPLTNIRIADVERLKSPAELLAELPRTSQASATVVEGRREIEAIIDGQDKRLLMIVGPCSIHDKKAALEYAGRLVELRNRYAGSLAIVMRVYFEKPRTTTGWTGLINSPDPFGPPDIDRGRYLAREIMMEVNELGIPVATELLDPLSPQFFSDLISWGAIGARTTESQTHRQMASGLSFPVGMKNGTGGSGEIAINAMLAAKSPHTFVGIDENGAQASFRSTGNPYTQLILRGGKNGPNYDADTVLSASVTLHNKKLPKWMIVDCSHANAEGDFRKQAEVLDYILTRRNDLYTYPVAGAMIESNLCSGKQSLTTPEVLEYGVSITDGCVGWEETEVMLADAYKRT